MTHNLGGQAWLSNSGQPNFQRREHHEVLRNSRFIVGCSSTSKMKSKRDQKKKKAPVRAALGATVAASHAGGLSPEAALFRHEQINLPAKSGWNSSRSICEGLKKVNLPAPTAGYLESAFASEQWARAYHATTALRDHCKNARYADQAIFGVLLVPDPNKLDTRGGVDSAIRRDQTEISAADIVDKRLPAGNLVTKPGIDWTLVATITGSAGIFLGSYNNIRNDESAWEERRYDRETL
jgi:hypothetical protein